MPTDQPPSISERTNMTTLNLTITVPGENADVCIDAINETLNTLAREDVLDDEHDDAWKWSTTVG